MCICDRDRQRAGEEERETTKKKKIILDITLFP